MPINLNRRLRHAAALATATAAISLPSLAMAQTLSPEVGPWHFAGAIYAYLPSVSSSTKVPADSTGPSLNVDAGNLLEHLDFAAMGTLEAHNGRWGGITDLIYLKLSGSKQGSRDFSIGQVGLPASTSANFDAGIEGWAWTTAGEYRLASGSGMVVDALGGFRLIDVPQNYTWTIAGDLGPLTAKGRSGSSEINMRLVDAIVGVKGLVPLDAARKWSARFYADVGAGDSKLTWQVAAGASYAFSWGEILAMWRYLSYTMKPGQQVSDIRFSGPMVGAAFRW